MNLLVLLLSLWCLILSGLYVRQSYKTKVLREDIERLTQFARDLINR